MKNGSLVTIPIIAMLFLIYMQGTIHSHYAATPKRERITHIPANDPAVLDLKQFARQRGIDWQITPDSIDGTDYCADLTGHDPFRFANSCGQTIREAVIGATQNWDSDDLRVGSK